MNKLERQIEIAKCDMMIAKCKRQGEFKEKCLFLCEILPYVGVGIACFVLGLIIGRGGA